MMYIALTETDKRVLIALCFVLIFVFVLAGYIGLLIARIMKRQGMKMDNMMHDLVITRVVSNKKQFISIARKKNWAMFYKATWIPLLILFVSFIIWITCQGIYSFEYSLFDSETTGFTTLFFTFNWADESIYTYVFGMKLLAAWPPVVNTPHFEVEAIGSYLFLPTFLTGIIWYLWNLQGLIARTYKMYKLADAIYEKNLEGFNINKENMEQLKTNQSNINQMMWNQVMNQVNGVTLPNDTIQNMNNPNQVNQNPQVNPNQVNQNPQYPNNNGYNPNNNNPQ